MAALLCSFPSASYSKLPALLDSASCRCFSALSARHVLFSVPLKHHRGTIWQIHQWQQTGFLLN